MKKDNILRAIQIKTPLSYKQVEVLFSITKSYDAILEVNELALKYNRDVTDLALYLYNRQVPPVPPGPE